MDHREPVRLRNRRFSASSLDTNAFDAKQMPLKASCCTAQTWTCLENACHASESAPVEPDMLNFPKEVWPGQDYSNPRISDFRDVENYGRDLIALDESWDACRGTT